MASTERQTPSNCGETTVTGENDCRTAVDRIDRLEAKGVTRVATWGRLLTAIIVSSLAVDAGRADGPRLESGLRVGEIANMFPVRAITGPHRGKTLCYRCELGSNPVVCVFARRITAPLTSLLKQLEARIASGKDGLKALVVFLTDDPKETAQKLEALAAQCVLVDVPLTLVNNPYGPQDYKIADDAEVTILMWKGPTVRVNRAYSRGGMTEADVKDVVSDLPKVMKD
jgi:hypothetical protein